MRPLRLILLLLGLTLLLGLLLWLILALRQLHQQFAVISPLLANGLVLLFLGLFLALLGGLIYGWSRWWYPQRRSRRRRHTIPLPADTRGVAQENLQAVQQQIAQVQDQVARQVLEHRSQVLARHLSRQELHLVVFGVGAAGKTALVNALLGKMAGAVGAPMGTTTTAQTHRIRLRGLERAIAVTDTPGITEMGSTGKQREQMARRWAAEADLLVFMVDGDLPRSAYGPLQSLAAMGKRVLLVFNKGDRYSAMDRDLILERLRQRLAGILTPEDVVAIAAQPQPVTLADGQTLQPEPVLLPLIQRLAEILRDEGDTLIADNILLQSHQLGEDARRLIDQQRQAQAEKIVEGFQWVGGGVMALTPLPGLDLLATAAVNAQMVVAIGQVYGCHLSLERGKELALSLGKTLLALGVVKGTTRLFTAVLEFQVSTLVIHRAIQGVSAAYLTRIAGKSFIEYFRQNQDWGDGGMAAVVQEQFQLNRRDEFVKAFIKEAIAQVVDPLR